MMNVLRSLAFYAAFYGGSAIYVLASIAALVFSPPLFRRIAEAWSFYHRACVEKILRIKVIETGLQATVPAIYAIKHESFFEAIDLPNLLNHPAGFAKQELFAIPGWGRAAEAYGAIPVARDQGAKALRQMVKDARRFLAMGRPLAIFPEGTRVPRGTHAPLQSGFAALYKLLGLPVIPVAVNSGHLYHRRWKKPGTIIIHFGDPIEPGLPREEVEQRVIAAINALNPETASAEQG